VHRAGVKNVLSPNWPFKSQNFQRAALGCIYDYMDSWSDFECMDTKNAKFPNWVLRHRMLSLHLSVAYTSRVILSEPYMIYTFLELTEKCEKIWNFF